jgi:hypothetical protein
VITARSAFTATLTQPSATNKRLWEQVVLRTRSASAITAYPPRSVVEGPTSRAISQSGCIWFVGSGYLEVRLNNAQPTALFLHFTNDNPGMIGTLYLLFSIHGRQRDSEREKRLQYWREQVMKISYTTGEHSDSPIFPPTERFPPKHLADARNSPGFHILKSWGFVPSFGAIWCHNGRLSSTNIAI